MTIPAVLRPRPIRWGAAVYLAVTAVCTQVPLVNYLGYEFSFTIAIVATAVAGWTSIVLIGATYRMPGSEYRGTMGAFRNAMAANLLLLLIPFLLMIVNAAIVKNCSLFLGMGFFVGIPVVTVIFSSSLALFCALHYRHPKSAYAAVVCITVLYAMALGYWTPAIFSYNFFYGYFPGVTYDEILELRWPLVIFRILTLLAAAFLIWLGRLLLRATYPGDGVKVKGLALLRAMVGRGSRVPTAAALVIIMGVYLFRCELGFESTSSYVRHALGAVYATEHTTIYYDSSSISKEQIRRIAADHEFRLAETWNTFFLPHKGRIESYIYPSAAEKQRLIGAGLTSIAKPWRKEVHCSKQSLDAVLKHELTHVVAGVFGLPVIHANLSPGLTEGLATALEGTWGRRTLHQYAAAILRAGLMPDMRGTMKITGFASQVSSLSYVLAGSFCRFLMDRFGVRKLTQVYGGENYTTVYGRSLEDLLREWDRFLARVPEDMGDEDVVDALFRRPPIFRKVCVRVIAERNKRARGAFDVKDFQTASGLYAASYNETGNSEALSGWLASALRSRQYSVVTAAYDSIIAPSARPGEYLGVFLPVGDAYWAQDRVLPALKLYDRLERADISQGLTESATLRALAIDDERCEKALRDFFLSTDPDSLRIMILDSLSRLAPDDIVVCYLRGKVLFGLRRFEEALAEFRSCTFADVDARLEGSRLRGCGEALLRLQRYQDAKAAFWMSLNADNSPAVNAEVDDWIERCDWMAEHGLP